MLTTASQHGTIAKLMSFKNYQFHSPQTYFTGIVPCGYTTLSPMQKKAIPSILTGRNILGLHRVVGVN